MTSISFSKQDFPPYHINVFFQNLTSNSAHTANSTHFKNYEQAFVFYFIATNQHNLSNYAKFVYNFKC